MMKRKEVGPLSWPLQDKKQLGSKTYIGWKGKRTKGQMKIRRSKRKQTSKDSILPLLVDFIELIINALRH